MKNFSESRSGFTLIEISIVLVIIGLIVSGVLVGQDLIVAAQIRATISQIQKYDTAVNTFQEKYGGLPGDLNASTAAGLGFFAMNGGVGLGDGNGLIDHVAFGGTSRTGATGESLLFWRHLTDAALIDGSFGTTGNSLVTASGGTTGTVTNVSQSFPPAKLGRGNYFLAFASDGVSAALDGNNYFQIQGILKLDNPFKFYPKNAMTPLEAAAIDTKLDDGLPTSGNIQAMAGELNTPATPGVQGASKSNCTQNTTVSDGYDTTTSGGTPSGDVPNCGIRIRIE